MSISRILIGSLIATLFVFATDYLFYGILMSDYFSHSSQLESPRFLWIILGTFVLSYAFCHMYVRGLEANKPPVAQGIRFGVLVALIVFIYGNMMQYATSNLASMEQVLTNSSYRVVQMVILGILIALYFGAKGGRPGMASGGDA